MSSTQPGPGLYALTDFSNGIAVGGLMIAPVNQPDSTDPTDPANNPTVITFADGTTQQTSATVLSAMMAVIFGG
jgi:hypothetical protein